MHGSPAQPWDESSRPTAPQPADPTSTAEAVGKHLVDVHDHLRRELADLHDLIGQVEQARASAEQARSQINQMTLRQNDWSLGAYCSSYCRVLTGHHSLEDAAIFPHLRSSDPELGPVLDRLVEEHVAIHGLLDGLDRALVDYIRDPGDTSGIRKALDVLSAALLSHLTYEEREIVAPLGRFGFYPGQVEQLTGGIVD